MKRVLSGGQAVAEAVRLCGPKVIGIYPITPQTTIIEALSSMKADRELDAEIIEAESEHSAMAACIGAQATGVRSYTATAGQGLALMHEMLFVASGMRLPIVMTVSNRALSAPLNIWNDQQDSFSERDSGWIQLYVENAQEAFDTQIQAFRIAEETRTPVMVCMDGFIVSHTYETVELLGKDDVGRFLPEYAPRVCLNPSRPMTLGAYATPQYYMYFKKQQQDALEASKDVIRKINREYGSLSGRMYGNGLIEKVGMEGKEHAVLAIGSVASTMRDLLEKHNIGMIKIKSLRPFPAEEIAKECANLKSIGVVEKDISLGANGALYDEVRAALYSSESGPRPRVSGFIVGLGGRDVTIGQIEGIFATIKEGSEAVEWII